MTERPFDLEAAWRDIERVPSPGPAGPPPRPVLPRLVGQTAVAAAAALRVLRRSVSGVRATENRAEEAVAACLQVIRSIEARWQRECGDTGFIQRRRELERSKQILEGIETIEAEERKRKGREERQQRRRERLQQALTRGVGDLEECRRAVLARRAELAVQLEEAHRRLARLRAEGAAG